MIEITQKENRNTTNEEEIMQNIEKSDIYRDEEIKEKVKQNLVKMKGYFTKNQGQLENDEIYFTYTASDKSFRFYESSVFIKLTKTMEDNTTKSSIIKIIFENSNRVIPVGMEELKHKSNYFIGNDSSKWKSNVPHYEKIVYEELYDGIDLVYYFNEMGLKYDWVVKPYADANQIIERFEGIDSIEIDSNGDLIIKTNTGKLQENNPHSYQKNFKKLIKVVTSFRIINGSRLTYKIGDYNNSKILIIDPLIYSTFFGGIENECGNSIVTDFEKNVYITGQTLSVDFPTQSGCFDDSHNSSWDAFITKLNPNGEDIIVSTYFGGLKIDKGLDIAIDTDKNIYITGVTFSRDFPVTNDSYDNSSNDSDGDSFISKLNPEGTKLIFSTFVGGNKNDESYGIAIDSNNCTYIIGTTESSNFPTSQNAFDKSYNGNDDVFVFKLNPLGSALIYSTYIGGDHNDVAGDIDITSSGFAVIVGGTLSTEFPITSNAYDISQNGGNDFFIIKLNLDGSDLIYSTFIGGSEDDGFWDKDIILDSEENAYIVGNTRSSDFPTTKNAYDRSYNGGGDAIVLKINSNGSNLIFSTFIGGSSSDYGYDITIDSFFNSYVVGWTESYNFPTTDNTYDDSINGNHDSYMVVINIDGTNLRFSTYVGGGENDRGFSITVDYECNIYLIGETLSSNFPTTLNCFDDSHNGKSDIYVVKFGLGFPLPKIDLIFPLFTNESDIIYFFGNGSDDGTIISYEWRSNIDGLLSNEKSFYSTKLSNGTHIIYFKVKDNNNTWSDETSTIITINGFPKSVIENIKNINTYEYQIIYFYGNGTDDGTIDDYNWTSSIDGFLSSEKSFSLSNLSIGTHTILFKVKDNFGIWSEIVEETLTINPKQTQNQKPTVSFSSLTNGTEIDKSQIICTIKGTSSDDDKVTKVQIKIDDEEWQDTIGTTTWTYEWDVSKVNEREHTINIRAFDGYNYSETKKIDVFIIIEDEITYDVKLSTDEKINVKAGEENQFNITVKNSGTTQVQISFRFEHDLKEWIFVRPDDVVLNVNKTEEIKVSISVPKNTKKGNYKIVIVSTIKNNQTVLDELEVTIHVEKEKIDGGEDSNNFLIFLSIGGIVGIIGILGFVMYIKKSSEFEAPQQTQFQTQQIPHQNFPQQFQQKPHMQAQQFKRIQQQSPTQSLIQTQNINYDQKQPCPFCNVQVPIQFKFCNMCGKQIKD